MTDRYRQRLAHAKWTWREGQRPPTGPKSNRKDRQSGRAEKRRARQGDRREMEADRA